MAKADMFKWVSILTSLVLGLGLVLEPRLISSLPVMLHYILGALLLVLGGYAIMKSL